MTKQKFRDYLKVQKSNLTNMFDIKMVLEIAQMKNPNTTLTKEDCLDIMKNYIQYEKEYSLTIN